MQGLGVRLARGLNRVRRRHGRLLAERYHARILRSPRQVKLALRYVLLNARHHARDAGVTLGRFWIDPFSSAAWFSGWRRAIRAEEPWIKDLLRQPRPTATATCWLLETGWRRHGLLDYDEVPGAGRGERPRALRRDGDGV